jgi:hypothetical protein
MLRVKMTPSTIFTPTQITGCVLWLDGSDPAGTGVQPSNGATVSTWVDKATAKNATATGTPTYLSGGGINFNASPYFLNQTFTMNLSQRSIFIVMQETSRNTGAGVIPFIPTPSSGSDYNTTGGLAIETASGLRFLGNYGPPPGSYLSALGNTNLLVKAIYNDSMNGTTGSGYLNGTNSTNVTADYTASNCSGYVLGGRWELGSVFGSSRLNGVIYEVIVFNTPLTTAQRQQVEGYLAQKWGLTGSLPPFHPGLKSRLFPSLTKNTILNSTNFLPTNISGCRVWFDAFDASYTVSGTTVTGWTNKTGNANASTGSGTVSINQATLNGKSSVRFAAGTNYLNVGAQTYTTSYRNQFFVVTVGASSSFYFYLNCNDTICGQCYSWNDSDIEINRFGTLGLRTYPTRYFNSTSIVSICTSSGPNTGIFVNGVSQTLSDNNVGTGGFWSGGTATGITLGGLNGYTTGTLDMYELLQYDGELTTAQRQQIEGYLAQKWGLTGSLPPFHPAFRSKLYPSLTRNRLLYARGFSPLSILGCQLWLDANDPAGTGIQPANNSTVSTWVDKSGNGRNTTTTGTVTYSNSGISITSSSSYLTGSFGSPDYTGTTLTAFIVASMSSSSGSVGRFFSLGKVGTQDWDNLASFVAFGRGGGLLLRPYRTSPTQNPPSIPAYDTRFLATSGQTPSLLFTSINGGILSTQALSGSFAINAYRIGNDLVTDDANEQFNGVINEIVLYFSELTIAQRQQIEGYLAWKWGIQTSLFLGHPYLRGVPMDTTFSPLSIDGCQLWLDGNDPLATGSLPANNATLSTWVDKSGNGYNATAAPSRTAGTYSTTLRAVYFPTSNTGYITNYTAAPTNETMFVVFNNPTASYNNNILIGGVQGARSLGAGYSGNGGNIVGVVGNLNTQVAWLARTDVGGIYTLGTTALVTSEFTTSTNTISLNGGTVGSGGAPGFTAGRVTYLGVDATNASYYYIGYAMEIIFYNSVLNVTQRQQVQQYLAQKWNITLA